MSKIMWRLHLLLSLFSIFHQMSTMPAYRIPETDNGQQPETWNTSLYNDATTNFYDLLSNRNQHHDYAKTFGQYSKNWGPALLFGGGMHLRDDTMEKDPHYNVVYQKNDPIFEEDNTDDKFSSFPLLVKRFGFGLNLADAYHREKKMEPSKNTISPLVINSNDVIEQTQQSDLTFTDGADTKSTKLKLFGTGGKLKGARNNVLFRMRMFG